MMRRTVVVVVGLSVVLGLSGSTGAGAAGSPAEVSAAPDPRGALACTMHGTPGADVLVGTRRNDVICGRGGRDVLKGRGGEDVLLGDSGNDTLLGGGKNDWFYGGPGNDLAKGGGGADWSYDVEGNDAFYGGTGDDCADVLDFLPGDKVVGDDGTDTYAVDLGDYYEGEISAGGCVI